MRILFDQVVYDMRNKGNVALLQVALNRIHKFWPEASLDVLTLSPHLLSLYCPDALPLEPSGSDIWQKNRSRYKLLHKIIPGWIWRSIFELREEIWRRRSPRSEKLISLHQPFDNGQSTILGNLHENLIDKWPHGNYSKLVEGANLFIATGAQYMSDACKNDALEVLDRLEAAIDLGIPTAMVGQGIGPIKDPELITKSRCVLPKVDLIFVRDKTSSPQLLSSLNVDPSRICMTGDDAIEMVYGARTNSIGNGIGVSWRVAHYTELENHHLQIVKMVLDQAVEKYQARLIAVPISHSAHELDDQFIRKLLAGHSDPLNQWRRFDSPMEIIKKVSNCRLVIAGTFHAVVFALAQGIPAIGLAKSEMYREKFLGLVDQFGSGIQVIYLDDEQLIEKLENAIGNAWDSAERIRPHLLEAARFQIQQGQIAYQRLYQMVESKYVGKSD
jgi:polysaccharide pyruvyl transferase WcaK-like protein